MTGAVYTEVRQHRSNDVEGAKEIGVESRLCFFDTYLLNGAYQAEPSIVDHNVDAAELFRSLLNHLLNQLRVSHVQLQHSEFFYQSERMNRSGLSHDVMATLQ